MTLAGHTSILVLNSGSSSLKFKLIDPHSGLESGKGLAEKLNTPEAILHLDLRSQRRTIELPQADHRQALKTLLEILRSNDPHPFQIDGIGHRVVHGGESFTESVLIHSAVIEQIERCIPLAPLHNPANLEGIRILKEELPEVPHVAVFDTSFHQTLPERAWRYAIPDSLYRDHHIRRYGFHGTSHRYICREASKRLGRPVEAVSLVSAHLGNGCSACAIQGGKSLDTTMGLTPLEGLVMGTRSGDVDPNLYAYLEQRTGATIADIEQLLNRKSGLLGLSGLSNDLRHLEQAHRDGHASATLAIQVFCYRLAKGILAMTAALPRLDALVFTGGIGENSSLVRTLTCEHLNLLNLKLDEEKNRNNGADSNGNISSAGTSTCWVIPTNEELMIAQDTLKLMGNEAPGVKCQ